MNKKLTSLFLAMAMSLGTFAGCANQASEENVEATADTEEVARVAMTLTLALPSDNFTEESRQQVEDALNRLTTAQFDTAIELKLYPRDEYRDAYMAQLEQITNLIAEEEAAEAKRREELKELKKQGITVQETETESTEESDTEEETIINDLGISIKQYPDVGEKQFDIFLVTNYEDYNYLIENDLIQQLDTELTGTSKILKTYIYPDFLTFAGLEGTYAIPNNHPVGEYQWLLVNKELVDTYYYDPDSLKTLLTCNDFIKDIANQNIEGVTPLLGKAEASNMVYWGREGQIDEWSIIGSQITNNATVISRILPRSIFDVNVYTNTRRMMLELDSLGYIGDGVIDDGEKFAVGVIDGNASVYETYGDDYYIYPHAKPIMTMDDIFGSMFAVSTYSKSLARSMEVITYLNTSKDVRTVLQYGVEGIHWEYDDDTQETISILSDDYQMRLTDTGNVYMTYPGEGRSMAEWEYGKQQNIDAIVTPYMLFPNYLNENNEAQSKNLAALSKEYKQKFDALTFENFDEGLAEIKAELKENEDFSFLVDSKAENSISYIYAEWFTDTSPTYAALK